MPPALVDYLTFTRAFRELYVTNIVIQYYDRLLLVQLSQTQPYRCLPRRQYILRLSPTPASTPSYAIPCQSINCPTEIGSWMQVRVRPSRIAFIVSQSVPNFEPSRTDIAAYVPWGGYRWKE